MTVIDQILADILRIAEPSRVVLYGKKIHTVSNAIKSLDFCITTDHSAKEILHKLTLGIDYDIPIGFKVYTDDDWEKLMSDTESYAYLIAQKGTVLYER